MADSKVSALTAATTVGGSDKLYLIQSSTSKSVTANVIYSSIINPILKGNIAIGDTRQTLGAAGVISNTLPVTILNIPGTDGVCTIHNGKEDGQLKTILVAANAGGTFTINRANVAGNANVQFFSSGQTATLMYQGDKWYVIGGTANVTYF
jgi:hypothetical protein